MKLGLKCKRKGRKTLALILMDIEKILSLAISQLPFIK
jgi:hypothetical protein